MKKITISFIVLLCLVLSVSAAAADTGFSDMAENAWYAEAVQYVKAHGLMNGTSTTPPLFSPDADTSRAMVATVLYRNAGSPASTGTRAPSDVPSGAWYADAAAWATGNGIIAAYADGRFGGNDPIPRELLAYALWSAAGKPASGEAFVYADQAEISASAVDAVCWAKNAGLMNGVGGNRFDPQGHTTRAVLATILMRLNNLLEQNETEKENDEMVLKINGNAVSVTWEENESVTALRGLTAKGPITVNMSMYGGFEQVGPLGTSLPRNDVQTTTSAGDIILYSGNQIVVFYGSNSWAYTRLGKITGMSSQELRTLLGRGNVTLTLE